MTPAQLTAFKAAINADANVAAMLAAGDHYSIAAYYNGLSAVNVWRPKIMVWELNAVIDWNAFKAFTALVQNTYFAMTQGGWVDATAANIRSGFVAVFGAGSATTTALTAMAKRTATRLEALAAFYTTTGAPDGVSTVFGMTVSPADVSEALARG